MVLGEEEKWPKKATPEEIQARAVFLEDVFTAWNEAGDRSKMPPPPAGRWTVVASLYYILLNGYKFARMGKDSVAQAPKAAACMCMAISLADPLHRGGDFEDEAVPTDSTHFAVHAAFRLALMKIVCSDEWTEDEVMDKLEAANVFFFATQRRILRLMAVYSCQRGAPHKSRNPFYDNVCASRSNALHTDSLVKAGLYPFRLTFGQIDILKHMVSTYEGILGGIKEFAI